MIGFESFRVALRSLSSNKLRTGLTMLGIIIGVGAVIVMLAIGQGAAKNISSSISSMGTNLLTVMPGNPQIRGPMGGGAITTLVTADATAIEDNLKSTVARVASNARGTVTVKMGNKNSQTSAIGTDPDYEQINNAPVSSGRFITKNDVTGRLKVAVVGPTVLQNLLDDPSANPVGQDIEINRIRFKIIGVMKSKGSGAFGQDQDDVVIIPLTTALRRVFNRTNLSNISVEATSPQQMALATEQMTALLRRRHHIKQPYADNDDFAVRSQSSLLEMSQSVTGTMTALLGGVAVVSLIVGGIGIMNIMIVSVTERTREIGIRKAVGATGHDILIQFLAESLVVSVLGGLLGITFGVGGSWLIGKMLGWPTVVQPQSVLLAFLVSGLIGVVFGVYPARKAAKLHPIDALRFE